MKKIIELLKEMRIKEEQNFITNSLIKRASLINSPIPDVDADLDRIAALNEAISVLNNHLAQKPCKSD
jgi:hypothetical protein